MRRARSTDDRPSRPVRTCSGCGERDAQPALLRLVLENGRLVADPARRRMGRGAYLHLRTACLVRFTTRKPNLRSLRASVPATERLRLVTALTGNPV